MSRETENALLLLVGISTAMVAITGCYTRYVRPSLLGWLLAAAVVLVVLAVTAMIRTRRNGHPSHDQAAQDDGHRHSIIWLLAVPTIVLIFVVPPALAARAAAPTVTSVSNDVLRRAFPPLPADRAPEVSLPEVVERAAYDTAGTLDRRLITVTGFTYHDSGRTDLARVVITCCAADAQLARIHLDGAPAAAVGTLPDETWLRVEGVVSTAPRNNAGGAVPTLQLSSVSRIDAPANPYAYRKP